MAKVSHIATPGTRKALSFPFAASRIIILNFELSMFLIRGLRLEITSIIPSKKVLGRLNGLSSSFLRDCLCWHHSVLIRLRLKYKTISRGPSI